MATAAEILKVYAGKRTNLPQTLTMEHVSGATRLMEKRRQMFEVQEALDAQKEEFARREDAFRRREDALRRKDVELQESLIKFNKFLQENESKRSRAVKRAQDEKKQRELKDQQISGLRNQHTDRLQEEKKMKRKEDENLKYQQYLSMVVDYAAKDYTEIEDVISRYRVLVLANRDLLDRQEAAETENDRLAVEYSSTAKERANEILNYSNQIASLQKQLEVSCMNVLRVQNDVDVTIGEISSKTLELWQVLGSVENLLERCEQGLKTKVIKQRVEKSRNYGGIDVEAEGRKAMERLDSIAMYMTDFTDIVDDHQTQKRSAAVSQQQQQQQQQQQGMSSGDGNVPTW